MDVNRVRVVIVVDEVPLFDRTEPSLNQRNVRKRVSLERVDERLGIGFAGVIIEKPAVDEQRAATSGVSFERSWKGVGAEFLPGAECRRNALAFAGTASQRLRREDEESVGIADRRRQAG